MELFGGNRVSSFSSYSLETWHLPAIILMISFAGLAYRFRFFDKASWPQEKATVTALTSMESAEDKITPLINFDWSITEPLVLRTFKPQYHITMGMSSGGYPAGPAIAYCLPGIEKMKLSEWILIDKHYKDRIELRRNILRANRDHVLGAAPSSRQTIQTLYKFLVEKYLPDRYRDIFQIVSGALPEESYLFNRVTGDRIPLMPSASLDTLLEDIARQVEEDFLVLQRDTESDEFILGAYVACFPNGFDWANKSGKNMSQIHVPVPDYATKLKKSLNRYLSRIEPGQIVKRHNWSISTSGKLFSPVSGHLYEGDLVRAETVDFEKACLRCERQVLHRLPQSDDVILTIRTYMYLLKDIKAEGNGPSLAAAIDGLQTGSSPSMYFYKKAPSWSDSVKAFLVGDDEA
ncbi:hypothetical protein GQ53DRAFT_752787 [Thozetella sp. PMI_491]|nr:hypothetical protein GQ53DRAFT_752787 [Thozetella sp. PMI_491]